MSLPDAHELNTDLSAPVEFQPGDQLNEGLTKRFLPRRPRILPVLIVAAVTMGGLRVSDLIQSDGLRSLVAVDSIDLEPGRPLLAQDEAADAEVEPTEAMMSEDGADMAVAEDMAADADDMTDTGNVEMASLDTGENDGLADDPPVLTAREALNQIEREEALLGDRSMTEAELDMLMSLAQRREALEEREAVLDGREALLKATEIRIDEKVAQLDNARAEIEALIGNLDEAEEERLARLVQVYEIMKPGEAARIFDGLERDVLLEVMKRMNERKLAPIMANMNPALAQELTSDLALRRRLPELPES
ncbi:MAG: hypothetical protein AAGC83_13490 [Pseudomonadota bacterium]